MPDSPQDVHKKVLGRKGEKLVAAYLKKQRCKILERNYKTPFGEADIIVQDGDEIAFVEVKTRTGDRFGTPREAVGTVKQHRYYKIAECFWLKTGEEPNARFDVAEVYEDGRIEYYKNAF
ncbi:MAG: YraN family protein [Clostridia bacterium]|nr:YraN family protein [Clostridia bacterium]